MDLRPAAAVVFDLDGTLVDSDAALDAAWVACGVAPEDITHGHVLAAECARLGVAVEDYLAAYDPTAVVAFPGVEEMLAEIGRWAVCSNKRAEVGPRELDALGWRPEVALFADAFAGPKELPPVLDALGLDAETVVFVGDTDHDRRAADAVGCRFVWAGWNPRVGEHPGDEVAAEPADVVRAARGQLLG
ncbi:HAD family hydrolase [Actinomarinicola tropica]|nr:HAD-IA family hydrolase [Actinomarinicola tropica]